MHDADKVERYSRNISSSGLTIYDPIDRSDPDLWIPSPVLEVALSNGLRGMAVKGLPSRSRSKVVKTKVCQVLGYPAPESFKKTKPRFPGQQFDTYTLKRENLQIWNEDITPNRRYALIRISADDVIEGVKVISGEDLARHDTTGTLTQKYQARVVPGKDRAELVSPQDTKNLTAIVDPDAGDRLADKGPIDSPREGELIPIADLFDALSRLVGASFPDKGLDQERIRGADLH